MPALADLPRRLHALPELEAALSRMLDDAGALHDDASPRLARAPAALRDLRQDIEERLEPARAERRRERRHRRPLRHHPQQSLRRSRSRAATAARMPGVVQDRSASGETLFVEPMFAIDLNNRLLLLRKEEEERGAPPPRRC